MRKAWVYIDGVAYEKNSAAEYQARHRGVMPDLPDFVSPIDGRQYSGRAGLREHCAKHDVVPTAELQGLPPKRMVQERHRTDREVMASKRMIAEILNSRS